MSLSKEEKAKVKKRLQEMPPDEREAIIEGLELQKKSDPEPGIADVMRTIETLAKDFDEFKKGAAPRKKDQTFLEWLLS